MSTPSQSYRHVSYDLRPAKQVERRMILDTLQVLATHGFPIRHYQYTGLGSIYFVDFILFHKYLGLTRLLSAEYDLSVERRIHFNRPYASVQVAMQPIGDVIPGLDTRLQHILWLDYDSQLTSQITSDITLACHHLSPGSILLVTVDLEPPDGREEPHQSRKYYEVEAGALFEHTWSNSDFTRSSIPQTMAQLLSNAIARGVAPREGMDFHNLFKFLYADGHLMLTLGGMIVSERERHKLAECDFGGMPFVVQSHVPPFLIAAPRLTRKERLYLDSSMPCADDWLPTEFELTKDEVASYRAIYRYYPLYAELLL